MTIITLPRSRDNRRIEIDLSGPAGNAYNLLAVAEHLACRLRLDSDAIIKEMKGGDYDELVRVFDKYFSNIVTLYRGAEPTTYVGDDIEEGEGCAID